VWATGTELKHYYIATMTGKTKNLHIGRKLSYYKKHWNEDGDNHCFYCRCVLTKAQRTLDHMIPRARGGTNNFSNIVISCRPCNNAKAELTVFEFVEFVSLCGGIEEVKKNYGKGAGGDRLELYHRLIGTTA